MVDAHQRRVDRLPLACADGKAIHPIVEIEQLLQLIEVQPYAILATRHLGRIRLSLVDRRNRGAVSGLAGPGRDPNAGAYGEFEVLGHARVDGDAALRDGALRDGALRDGALRDQGRCDGHAQRDRDDAP